MNRVTFLFLALLIGSAIMTVNSRHQTRTLISEKEVLVNKVASLKETIRRLELSKARIEAKDLSDEAVAAAAAAAVACPTPEAAPAVAPAQPGAAKAAEAEDNGLLGDDDAADEGDAKPAPVKAATAPAAKPAVKAESAPAAKPAVKADAVKPAAKAEPAKKNADDIIGKVAAKAEAATKKPETKPAPKPAAKPASPSVD